MGRQLQRQNFDVRFEDHDYHPGCMWGILHVLDYHHWHDAKKMLPRKKHSRGRHAICCGNPKTISMEHNVGEVKALLDVEADHLLVEHLTKTSPGRAKALTTKEKFKGENYKDWNLGFSAHSQLQQTDSIDHLKPSEYHLGEVSSGWVNPIILIHNRANTSATRSKSLSLPKTPENQVTSSKKWDLCETMNAKNYLEHDQLSEKHAFFPENVVQTSNNKKQMAMKLNKDFSHDQVKEYVDVLEILKVKEELFLTILEDPNVGISKHLPGKQNANTKIKLIKSGSFPVADSSHARYLRPTTLQHKQNESWSFPKGQNLLAATKVPKSDVSRSQKDNYVRSVPLRTDGSVGSATKQETRFPSHGSSRVLDNQGWNHTVMNHFKEIKQRIKHALKERRKKNNRASKNALPHRVPSSGDLSTDKKEMTERSKIMTIGQDGVDKPIICHETDVSDYDLSDSRLHWRRTTSLNESLERYAQLLNHSFSAEAKWNHSKSLKLKNEDKIASRGRAPKFFRRISSLSDLESFCSFLNEVSRDSFSSDMPIRSASNIDSHREPESLRSSVDTDKVEQLNAVVETELVEESEIRARMDSIDGQAMRRSDEDIARTGELTGNIVASAKEDRSAHQDDESSSTMSSSRDLAQPSSVSVLESCSITGPAECPISEGSDLNPGGIHSDGPNSSLELQNKFNRDSSQGFCNKVKHENVEYANEEFDNHFLHFEVDEEDDAYFNYVRNVLELSGFLGENYLGKWHSQDQPLSSSLFKELEACLHQELECCTEVVSSSCDHQLLFDLTNEALLEIYDRSFTYFPRAFSFSRGISSMPKGHHVLKQVWTRISWHLRSSSVVDQTLDDIVGRDLAKGDGWMKLQLNTECVQLELEDLIFDELLDKVICGLK